MTTILDLTALMDQCRCAARKTCDVKVAEHLFAGPGGRDRDAVGGGVTADIIASTLDAERA
jgi:hypothetical protein